MNRDQVRVRAETAARRYDRAVRGEPDVRRAPTLRKGVVTSVDPLEVSTGGGPGLPATNWSGFGPSQVGERVLLAVDQGRRMVVGRSADVEDAAGVHATYTRTSTFTVQTGTHTLITWQSIVRQSGGWSTGSTLTVPESGLYVVTMAAHLSVPVVGWVQMTLTRNEASVTADAPFVVGGNNDGGTSANAVVQGTSHPLALDQGDVMRAFIFHNHSSDATFNLRGDVPILAFRRIGAT